MASPNPRSQPGKAGSPGAGRARSGAGTTPNPFGVRVEESPPSSFELWWRRARDKARELWTSKKPGAGIVKDLVIAAVVVLVLLGIVWAYTGQGAGQAPIVVVESGSMMHANPSYGRVGTIDPGDLVFVKDVQRKSEIGTFYAGGETHYGNPGDVIVFRRDGLKGETPIIHRAMAWLTVTCRPSGVEVIDASDCPVGDTRRYTIRELGMIERESVEIPEIGIVNYRPPHSGFITKGDNERSNAYADQSGRIAEFPVKVAWVVGVARGELPWFGLIKLALYGNTAQPDSDWCVVLEATAPCDTWVMLGVSLGVLVMIPLVIDFVQYLRTRRHVRED